MRSRSQNDELYGQKVKLGEQADEIEQQQTKCRELKEKYDGNSSQIYV